MGFQFRKLTRLQKKNWFPKTLLAWKITWKRLQITQNISDLVNN